MVKNCISYKHLLTGFVLIYVICLSLLMALTIFTYVLHDCKEDHCPICEEFQAIQTKLKKLGSCLPISILFLLFLSVFKKGFIINKYKYIIFETPIKLKVRLDH